MVLDLCGKTIDRALTETIDYGRLITVYGIFELVDSSYDMSNVYEEYEAICNRATQTEWNDKRNFIVEELKKIECGKLTGGNSKSTFGDNDSTGGVIHVVTGGKLTIYGGMFLENQAQYGMISTTHSTSTYIYDVLMVDNESRNDAGCIFNCGTTNIYNGLYFGNKATTGIIYCTLGNNNISEAFINIYGGIVEYNKSPNGGIINAFSGARVYIYDVTIRYNDSLGAYANASNSHIRLFGGLISENTLCGIAVERTGIITISGGIITKNRDGGARVGGYDSQIIIQAGAQIYNNILNDAYVDVILAKNQKLYVSGALESTEKSTRVGITLMSNYIANAPFTLNYGVSNTLAPSRYFFSNKSGKTVAFDENKTDVIETATTTSVLDVKWKVSGVEYTSSNAIVPYTGSNYQLSAVDKTNNTAIQIIKSGTGDALTYANLKDVGNYAYYVGTECTTPTFMLTIVPKEVDITWGNETLVYNGNTQVLSAVVAGYPDCKVTVNGGQRQAGSGYMAVATALSDPNLKIRGTRQTKEFSIERAKINAPSGTQTFILDGKEHTYTPTTGWDNTKMAIVDNKATEAGVHKATIMLKDPVNYQWATGGGRHIELEYTIEDKSIIKNNVYDFIYLEQNGDSILRKTYKEGNVYRMANDSEVISNNNDNKLIIGNIAPNTTVFEFMENLKVESNQISIYNGSKAIIENGAVASGINESLLRDKNEMPIGTGWRVVVNHEDEQTEEIYLSVLGDITGDGKVNTADVNVIRQIVNDKEVFENIRIEAKLASLILNKGKLATNSDAQLLWETACGRLDISDFI